MTERSILVLVASICVAVVAAGTAHGARLADWGPAASVESLPGSSREVNTEFLDGCPIQSPDGSRLYMASNRPGGAGGIDIWVATRTDPTSGFGLPVNLGAAVNSAADDFCPTPVRGGGLFFVSTRGGGCGGADIYFTRDHPVSGWSPPERLPCASGGGPNTGANEFSPSYVEDRGREYLFFSSGPDIFVSERPHGGFGPGRPVAELNSPADDLRPNVRKDGLEIVFDSTRGGGLPDIYAATRPSVDAPWSPPVPLGPEVNTPFAETRASLSWDGRTLLFGSSQPGEGGADIYIATRAAR